MILKSLSLKNFRKFKDSTIEFPDGVTGVVGLNGVGKSTIFEAIAWVLYGSVAARTSADQIKRQGSLPIDHCRVELEFVFEDDNYRIVREMSGKSMTITATATVNGKIAATSAESVNKYIQKKLGMDFKSFFTSIFAKQKELNTLSTMVASERRPLILRMLGIDSLDDIVKEIKSDKKEKDNLLDRLNKDLIDENGKDKIEIIKNEIINFEKQKAEIEKLVKKLKEKLSSSNKDLKTLERNYKDSKKEYEKINKKKEDLAEKKILFENKIKLQDEIKTLKEKVTQRQKIIDKEKKKLQRFKAVDIKLKSTDKRIKEIDVKIEKSIKTIEQRKTLTDRTKKDIEKIESKKKDIEKLGPDAKCPTCDRVLQDQHDVLIKKFCKEQEKLDKEIKVLQNEIKKEQGEKDKFSRELNALEKKKNYLQVQLREKGKIDVTISNILEEIKREKQEIENKNQEVKKIGTITFDKKIYEETKKQVEVFYNKYQSFLNKLSEKKDVISSLKIDLEKKDSDNRLVMQDIKNLKSKIEDLEKSKKQINDEKKTAYYLGILSEIMATFRTHLISRIRPTLSSYSSDFFERLTDGKYRELELDENYNLLVYDDGEAYTIERFSGGEEDLANLCLRLAISEVITERAGGVFNFIILDEIFGSQDIYRRQNILKALSGLSSKFRQIFLITHIDEIKDDMENIIYVSENETGISSVAIE